MNNLILKFRLFILRNIIKKDYLTDFEISCQEFYNSIRNASIGTRSSRECDYTCIDISFCFAKQSKSVQGKLHQILFEEWYTLCLLIVVGNAIHYFYEYPEYNEDYLGEVLNELEFILEANDSQLGTNSVLCTKYPNLGMRIIKLYEDVQELRESRGCASVA